MSAPDYTERLAEIAGRFIADGRTQEEADTLARATLRVEELNPRPLEDIRKLDLKRTWILDGILTTGIAVLAAKKGNWKSLLSMQAAYAIAAGAPFLDRASQRGPVLYLALELDDIAMSERAARLGPCPEGLDILLSFTRGEEALADIEKLLLIKNYTLIVVDMLSAILPRGTDGNAYDEVTPFMLRLRRIAQHYSACILCLMHSPKASRDDFADAVLGSTGFAGQADSILVLDRKRAESSAKLSITGNHGADSFFRIGIDSNLRITTESGSLAMEAPTHPSKQDAALDELKKANGEPISAAMVGQIIGTGTDQKKNTDNARKALEELVRQGKAYKPQSGRYALPQKETLFTEGAEVDEVEPF